MNGAFAYLPFAIGLVAITYVVADLALAIYVGLFKARRPELRPLAEVMGFSLAKHFRRWAFIYSWEATRVNDTLARFLIAVMRFTMAPALVGVTSLFVIGVAGQ